MNDKEEKAMKMNCPYCGNPAAPWTIYKDPQHPEYLSQEFWCGGLASAPDGCTRRFTVQLKGECLDPDGGRDDICTDPEHNHLARPFQVTLREIGGTQTLTVYVDAPSANLAKRLARVEGLQRIGEDPMSWEAIDAFEAADNA